VGVRGATSRAVVRARRLAEREGVDAARVELSTAASDTETPSLAVLRVRRLVCEVLSARVVCAAAGAS
jgi:hypothetical protein